MEAPEAIDQEGISYLRTTAWLRLRPEICISKMKKSPTQTELFFSFCTNLTQLLSIRS